MWFNVLKKRLLVIIIILLVGVNVLPIISGDIEIINNKSVSNIDKNPSLLNNLSWLWAKSVGGKGEDRGWGVEVDSYNNIYIVGFFEDKATFGNITLISQGGYDVFIAKISNTGNWEWVKSAGGIGDDRGCGVTIDTNGNICITGFFESTAIFGNNILISLGKNDVFIAKLNQNGDWDWVKSGGGLLYDYGFDVALDNNDNIYVTGTFCEIAEFGDIILTSQGIYSDVFVAKLDNTGNWEWVKSAGGLSLDEGKGVGIDSDNNIYIVGFFEDKATFGNITLISQGGYDVFIAKISNTGNWEWVKSAGGINGDYGYDITVDDFYNNYIIGQYNGTVLFGNISLISQGENDVFIAKLNQNGDWEWVKSGGGLSFDAGLGIEVDLNGNIYATGYFIGKATFGKNILTSEFGSDVFVVKINNTGGWGWVKSAGGEQGCGIALDAESDLFITGYFYYLVNFDNILLKSQGQSDIFAAKLSYNNPPFITTISGPNNGKPGIIYEYTFNAIDPDNNQVTYFIDWGDGKKDNTVLNPSGSNMIVTHNWFKKDEYIIKVYAQDEFGLKGSESTKTVTIPRNILSFDILLEKFVISYSNIFPFLQKLFNRLRY